MGRLDGLLKLITQRNQFLRKTNGTRYFSRAGFPMHKTNKPSHSGLSVSLYLFPGFVPQGPTLGFQQIPLSGEGGAFYNCFFRGRSPFSMSIWVHLTVTFGVLRIPQHSKALRANYYSSNSSNCLMTSSKVGRSLGSKAVIPLMISANLALKVPAS